MKVTLISSASAVAGVFLLMAAADAAGMLTAKNGMTLYVFDKDTGGMSSCYADCAKHWPPYVGKQGAKMETGWSLIKRKDGTLQWAYEGKPLYFYADDKTKGDMKGDGKGGMWHIVPE